MPSPERESEAYREALMYRLTSGIVPYDVILQLTKDEWIKIQNTKQRPVIDVSAEAETVALTLPRTITPKMKEETLEQLQSESRNIEEDKK